MSVDPFVYQIRLYPDPILAKKCEPLIKEELTDELKQIIEGIFPLLAGNDGYALTANQLGISKRFFVMDGDTDGKLVCINPEITSKKGQTKIVEECLSMPGIAAKTSRAETVEFQYRDLDWVLHTKTYTGIEARVIQHEIDHLNGMLFFTRLSPATRSMVQPSLQILERRAAANV